MAVPPQQFATRFRVPQLEMTHLEVTAKRPATAGGLAIKRSTHRFGDVHRHHLVLDKRQTTPFAPGLVQLD